MVKNNTVNARRERFLPAAKIANGLDFAYENAVLKVR